MLNLISAIRNRLATRPTAADRWVIERRIALIVAGYYG